MTGEAPPSQSAAEWEADLLLHGLSEWEADLVAQFREHTDSEADLIDAYADVAAGSGDGFVSYLLHMLLEDERRHHRMFRELANSILGSANLTTVDPHVPSITPVDDAERLRDTAVRFLALERQDLDQLGRLRRRLRSVRESTLWDLLIDLAERDTGKHIRILEFIRDHTSSRGR